MNVQVSTPIRAAPPAALRYQIHHYPTTLIDVRSLRDGTRLTLRPVLPQDDLLLAALVARLSPRARRNRFHGAVQLSAQSARRMSCIDYGRELAFVVTTRHAASECVIADARYCVDHDAQGAEFAVLVDEQWQRRGLGSWVMAALRDAAHEAGLHWLHGEVLSDNAPMLALMQRCGLCCTPDPEDDRLVQVQARLGAMPGRPRRHNPSALQQLQNWITR